MVYPQHTLSYWSKDYLPFDDIALCTWNKLQVQTAHIRTIKNLHRYSFRCIRAGELYKWIYHHLKNKPNVHFEKARVDNQLIDPENYASRYVLDSRPLDDMQASMFICGQGIEITTQVQIFNSTVVTFMDFLPHDPHNGFFYLLPFSETHALIDYAHISSIQHPNINYVEIIKKYINQRYPGCNYSIERIEGYPKGAALAPPTYRKPTRVINIGIRGGKLKPTSGFAFTHIVKEAQYFAKCWNQNQTIEPLNKSFFSLCFDKIGLRYLEKYGKNIEKDMSKIWMWPSGDFILKLLNED